MPLLRITVNSCCLLVYFYFVCYSFGMIKINEIPEVDPMFHKGLFRNTKKMTALFEIDRVNHIGTEVINEKSAWVFTDPTHATVKRDGTGVVITADGEAFVRRSVKKGKKIPEGFLLAEFDAFTETMFGVEPVEKSGFRKMFNEAVENLTEPLTEGTFELVGPKINGNPEGFDKHVLIRHGSEDFVEIPDLRTINRDDAFAILKEIFTDLKERGIEGVVWWGLDDRRVKLRVHDFFGDPNRR